MGRIVVLVSGNGTNLQALIEATASGVIPAEIACVVSNRASAYALERAASAGIPAEVLPFAPFKARAETRENYDKCLVDLVSEHRPDLIILAGWMRILTPVFINAFPSLIVNLHPALPGAYPGRDAIERAWTDARSGLIYETGVMVHRVIEEVDAGQVLGMVRVSIADDESLESLEARIHAAEHTLLVATVANLFTGAEED